MTGQDLIFFTEIMSEVPIGSKFSSSEFVFKVFGPFSVIPVLYM